MSSDQRADARYDDRRYGNPDDNGWKRSHRTMDAGPSSSTPHKHSHRYDHRSDSGRAFSPRRSGDHRDASYRSADRTRPRYDSDRHRNNYEDDPRSSRDDGWHRHSNGSSGYRMRSPGSVHPREPHSSSDSDYSRSRVRLDNYNRAEPSSSGRARERDGRRDDDRGTERRRELLNHLRSPGQGRRSADVGELDYGASRNDESDKPARKDASSPRRREIEEKDPDPTRENRTSHTDRRREPDGRDKLRNLNPYTTHSPPVKTLKRKTSPQPQTSIGRDDGVHDPKSSRHDEERIAKRPTWERSQVEKHPSSESAASEIRHSRLDSVIASVSTDVGQAHSTVQAAHQNLNGVDRVEDVPRTTMVDRHCPWPFEIADTTDRRIRKKDRPTLKPLNERRFVGSSSIDQYEVGVKLGQGTFGEVKKATHFLTGVEVALKKVTVHEEKDGMPITAIREIKLLKQLQHPSIVPIIDMAYRAPVERGKCGEVYMVEPYMDHDLNGMLENPTIKLNMPQIKLYMKQLFEGTLYMHQNKILHRDMKAANLLINNKGQLQIADFGLARPYHDPGQAWAPNGWKGGAQSYTGMVVTRWYRPPELLAGDRRYGPPIDMWGLGCILAEMIVKQPLFKGTSEIDQMLLISKLCGSPNESSYPGWSGLPGVKNADPSGRPDQEPDVAGMHDFGSYPRRVIEHFTSGHIIISSDMADLLDKLLVLDPKRRMTAQEALEHRWFWERPFPADPKAMPQYQASKEMDRQRRDQQKRLAQQQQQQQQQQHEHQRPPPNIQPQMHKQPHAGYPPPHHAPTARPHMNGHQGQYPRGGAPHHNDLPPKPLGGERRGPYPHYPPPSYGRPSR